MENQILFNKEARLELLKGVDILANAVKSTLGPKGRNVIINTPEGPHVTKDGVTVAKAVHTEDVYKNLGIQLVKDVASKTCEDAGDGTTTSTVLAQAMIKNGLLHITPTTHVHKMSTGIKDAVEAVVNLLKEYSREIRSYKDIKNIATISANNDESIGKIIADVYDKIGNDNKILISESNSINTTTEILEGLVIDRGVNSPAFLVNSSELDWKDPYIFTSADEIYSIDLLEEVLDHCIENDRPLVMFVSDISIGAVSTLTWNVAHNNLKACVIQPQIHGVTKKNTIEDISISVNSTYYDKDKGTPVSSGVTLEDLGRAGQAKITIDETTLIDCKGDKAEIEKRVDYIKSTNKDLEGKSLDLLQRRIALLKGVLAIIHVGGSSMIEVKEKKDRIEDALCATRAAIEEGIVIGGGSFYLKASHKLKNFPLQDDEDYLKGWNTVFNSIELPFVEILLNCGLPVKEINEHLDAVKISEEDKGFDINKECIDNLLDLGIVDPAKVTRTALENASSVAILLLTTECIIP